MYGHRRQQDCVEHGHADRTSQSRPSYGAVVVSFPDGDDRHEYGKTEHNADCQTHWQ
ncbi:hypothetical protein Pth03_25460 [Planotetraspora thailandica]|uniref:Uncharacterized protein n=1 Tax=Planotetraspora thailandica TaxID=487172 RepID=A0A8J3XTA9_9ACTN|nr:hypothetical protein [Planotetraspora thailandica]GII54157.1 hypothetical protein Pth03_25460 [Planotetraspora thailandica]